MLIVKASLRQCNLHSYSCQSSWVCGCIKEDVVTGIDKHLKYLKYRMWGKSQILTLTVYTNKNWRTFDSITVNSAYCTDCKKKIYEKMFLVKWIIKKSTTALHTLLANIGAWCYYVKLCVLCRGPLDCL